jgi:hypothetical protein
MKTRRLAIAGMIAASVLALAAGAQATMVAGWDFSQYRGPGLLSTDGATYSNTLDANYSDLDPTSGAGAESSLFGTLYFDGSFGSSSVPAGPTTTTLVPTAGSMACDRAPAGPGLGAGGCTIPNVEGPVRSNLGSFGKHTVLLAEGQTYAQRLGLAANSNASVVFEADLSGLGLVGGPWTLTLGGRTASGGGSDGGELSCAPACSSTVTVDFSTDGSSYTSVDSLVLTPDDEEFTVALTGPYEGADTGYVRLNFSPSGTQPVIDNVAVDVRFLPEPGASLGLVMGAASLLVLRRFRA